MSKTFSTKYSGVRYRQHATRKHGIHFDKYFFIRYSFRGKQREEGIGWASEGNTAAEAFHTLGQIKKAIKNGEPVATLAEQREEAEKIRQAAAQKAAEREAANITFDTFFTKTYLPHEEGIKNPRTFATEKTLYTNWIKPQIGNKVFSNISHIDCENIRKRLTLANKSLRTVQYCYAIIRQVFNQAKAQRIFLGDHPVKSTRKIKFDNKKLRFLTQEEARELLIRLKKHSKQTHDLTLLSLYCGARRGELFSLDCSDIDLLKRQITFRDTKNTKTRTIPMPEQVVEMLSAYKISKENEPLFTNKKGERINCISKSFERVVAEMKLNKGISDRRQKFTFHNCRHTYGSWLVQAGVSLYEVKELMGHENIEMTLRYAHLSPKKFEESVTVLSAMKISHQ